MQQTKEDKLSAKDKSSIDLATIVRIDDDGILYNKKGEVQRYLKVRTTDLFSLDDSDLVKFLDAFQLLNKVYTDDYKVIAQSSRVDTSVSQQYWRKLRMQQSGRKKTKQDEIRAKIQNENLAILINIERSPDYFKELEFYVVIYAKDKKRLQQSANNLRSVSGVLGLTPVGKEEVMNVRFRLNNMNSK